MEVMGVPFIDGEWESICKILSFDQDSEFTNSISHNPPQDQLHQHLQKDDDHHNGGSLIGLLMGNSNLSTSQCELGFPFNHLTNQHNHQIPTSFNHSQLSCISDLSNGSLVNVNRNSTQFVDQTYNDDDQISSLTSSTGFLGHAGFLKNDIVPIIKESTTNHIDGNDGNGNCSTKRKQEDDLPSSKKRSRVTNNRNTRSKKRKNEVDQDEEQKSSSEISDNESNGSQEVINEEGKDNPILNGKKRANRGAATDPQSLYARKRRERINERLRILQTLVPNGTKVDISTMLEEAVNYVKFLQMQIKLLSSDDMWMYAPLAYNGFDVGHYQNF